MSNPEFATWLAGRMTTQGISRAQLMSATDVTYSTVHRWLDGSG